MLLLTVRILLLSSAGQLWWFTKLFHIVTSEWIRYAPGSFIPRKKEICLTRIDENVCGNCTCNSGYCSKILGNHLTYIHRLHLFKCTCKCIFQYHIYKGIFHNHIFTLYTCMELVQYSFRLNNKHKSGYVTSPDLRFIHQDGLGVSTLFCRVQMVVFVTIHGKVCF